MGRVGEVMDVLDEGAVAVKEDRRASCVSRAAWRAGKTANRILPGLLECFVSADVQVITAPDPAPHPPHESGQHVEPQVECLERGDLAIGAGVDHVQARIGQVAGGLLRASRRTRRSVPSASSSAIPQARGWALGTAPWSTGRRASDERRAEAADRCR